MIINMDKIDKKRRKKVAKHGIKENVCIKFAIFSWRKHSSFMIKIHVACIQVNLIIMLSLGSMETDML